MMRSFFVLIFVSNLHQSLQSSIFEDSFNPTEISITTKSTRNSLNLQNSDEYQTTPITCHWDTKVESFNASSTCEIIDDIDSKNSIIDTPLNPNATNFLMINNKRTKFIPRDIGKNFNNLLVMIASGNSIRTLERKDLERLYRLKTLNLESNEIENVKFNAFDDLISLELLDLDNNKIRELDGKTFTSNMYLKIFSARNNEIATLHEDIFEHTIMLDTVKLEGNKISRLSHKMLDHVPHLNKLLLEKNVCVDKNYTGGKIVSTFAVDMARMCGDVEEVEEALVDEKSDCRLLVYTIALSVLITLSIVAGISYKVYKSKKWQVRPSTVDAFENPHYSKDPEKPQETPKVQSTDSYHEFHNKQLNDEARYVNLESLKNAAVDKKQSSDHLYEEVKEEKQKNEKNCYDNPNYGS